MKYRLPVIMLIAVFMMTITACSEKLEPHDETFTETDNPSVSDDFFMPIEVVFSVTGL